MPADLDPFCFVQNPCILHRLNSLFWSATYRNIFLEYESYLLAIEHCHIWGSVMVSGLFQDYENRSDSLLGASAVKLLMCSHVGFSCKFGT